MKSYDRLLKLANKFVRKIASERGYGFGNSLKFAQKEENFIDYSADFDGAFDSYIKTMLWYSEPTGQGENSDETFGSLGYSEKDLSEEARQQSKNDLKKFIALAVYRGVDLPKYEGKYIGHDFWLTRNHHGFGFNYSDYDSEDRKILTELSKEFGEAEPYLGNDGKIHIGSKRSERIDS